MYYDGLKDVSTREREFKTPRNNKNNNKNNNSRNNNNNNNKLRPSHGYLVGLITRIKSMYV